MSARGNKVFSIDLSGVERLSAFMEHYGSEAAAVITSQLAEEGLDTIGPAITRLLPASGRRWTTKRTAASSAGYQRVFQATPALCAVTIRTTPAYRYLYFPDDGSNTRRHQGNQRFMLRGAEAAAPQLIDGICSRLISKFEEG